MKVYHATTKESAAALRSEGASAAKVGCGGGLQGGWGFYASPTLRDAEYWADRVGACDAILEINLPDDLKIAEDDSGAMAWGIEQGIVVDGDNDASCANMLKVAGIDPKVAEMPCFSYNWLFVSLYFKAIGADAYYCADDQLVIVNFSLLSAEAFS